MAKLILTYTLKPGVSREQFEHWTRTVDYPSMRGLARVKSFVNHRTTGLLIGDGRPAADYVEVFDIPDLDGFVRNDLPGPVVQKVMGEFMGFVDNPQFMVAEEVA